MAEGSFVNALKALVVRYGRLDKDGRVMRHFVSELSLAALDSNSIDMSKDQERHGWVVSVRLVPGQKLPPTWKGSESEASESEGRMCSYCHTPTKVNPCWNCGTRGVA